MGENIATEEKLFCQYCPCVWCDGNSEQNKAITGYEFIPDPDHCKEMFIREEELTYDEFLRGVFQLHGSTINKDWHRFLEKEEGSTDGDVMGHIDTKSSIDQSSEHNEVS